eukprot:scaffold2133_cov39-Cyclotella_meneghiniana.AAC.2
MAFYKHGSVPLSPNFCRGDKATAAQYALTDSAGRVTNKNTHQPWQQRDGQYHHRNSIGILAPLWIGSS